MDINIAVSYKMRWYINSCFSSLLSILTNPFLHFLILREEKGIVTWNLFLESAGPPALSMPLGTCHHLVRPLYVEWCVPAWKAYSVLTQCWGCEVEHVEGE